VLMHPSLDRSPQDFEDLGNRVAGADGRDTGARAFYCAGSVGGGAADRWAFVGGMSGGRPGNGGPDSRPRFIKARSR
jgi:hypothetical protein